MPCLVLFLVVILKLVLDCLLVLNLVTPFLRSQNTIDVRGIVMLPSVGATFEGWWLESKEDNKEMSIYVTMYQVMIVTIM